MKLTNLEKSLMRINTIAKSIRKLSFARFNSFIQANNNKAEIPPFHDENIYSDMNKYDYKLIFEEKFKNGSYRKFFEFNDGSVLVVHKAVNEFNSKIYELWCEEDIMWS